MTRTRLSRIVTRGGDDGTTGLANGERLPKTDARIEAIGAVDELNSQIGLLRAGLAAGDPDDLLETVQHDLFDLGAELAGGPGLDADAVLRLDQSVLQYNATLPPLAEFILPGGPPAAAQAHVCRAICRRAERRVLALGPAISAGCSVYLNRLSDLLFILARTLARREAGSETLWQPASPSR